MSNYPPKIYIPDIDAVNSHLKTVTNLELGSQSHVGLIELADESEQLLLKQMGVGKGLNQSEAEQLHDDLLEYRHQLSNKNWNIPNLYETALVHVVDEWQIWGVEQFIVGTNAIELFRHSDNNAMKHHLIRQVMGMLTTYDAEDLFEETIHMRKVQRLPHGIDLKPSNIVVDNFGLTWMVDTFGPKTIDQNGNINSYNPKLDTISETNMRAVCATRLGLMLRFLRASQELFLDSGSSSRDLFLDDLECTLEYIPLPKSEVQDVMLEVEQGYPWLNMVYSK